MVARGCKGVSMSFMTTTPSTERLLLDMLHTSINWLLSTWLGNALVDTKDSGPDDGIVEGIAKEAGQAIYSRGKSFVPRVTMLYHRSGNGVVCGRLRGRKGEREGERMSVCVHLTIMSS